jgi:small-conductance mechanosensitive channel
MRLVAFCLILFLAPAGCLLVTDRFVSRMEDDFYQDSTWQVNRFNRIVEMYPPKASTIKNAAEIRQLKHFGDGHSVAASVCGSLDSPYKRLFERLSIRCGEWNVLRRSRYAALIGVVMAFFTLALVLVARIGVRRYENRKEWAGPWTAWFTLRGIHVVLALQVAAALAGFAILLQTLMARPVYAYAALFIPWLGLFWAERRTAAGFIQAQKLTAFRPKRRARAARARA